MSHFSASNSDISDIASVPSTVTGSSLGSLNNKFNQVVAVDDDKSTSSPSLYRDILNSAEADQIFVECTRAGYSVKKGAIIIKELLFAKGFLSDEWNYDDVIQNKTLEAYMLYKLGLGLPQAIEDSMYGLGLISDFHLYYEGRTTDNLVRFLTRINKTASVEQLSVLRSHFLQIKRTNNVVRKLMIEMMVSTTHMIYCNFN